MNLTAHDVRADDGTRLRVWEDAPESGEDAGAAGDSPASDDAGAADSSAAPAEAVLFVHGAITHSRALFAPPVEGRESPSGDSRLDASYSWLRATADAGRTAYALDVRGYGDSEFPPAMADPPEANDPPVRAGDAADDVAAAFDFATARHGRVHLVGVSWGTMTTGRFLADRDSGANATDVASYVQCAPVYDPPYDFSELVSAFGLDADLGAYYVEDRETVAERKDADENLALFEGVWRAMVESGQERPPTARTPTSPRPARWPTCATAVPGVRPTTPPPSTRRRSSSGGPTTTPPAGRTP
ncbi:alpha/beta fold hydrolase [Halorussus caseinilyticus]|uniref:Alpha/beta fold hydrolase n=1 Tax=Halorussus caseinilyticus TaxID=3034025 RepID=A0ABD5WDX6_9EURY